MKTLTLSIATLAGCAPVATQTPNATPQAQFSALQSRMGVQTFIQTCVTNLPDFADAPAAWQEAGFEETDSVWIGGGGAIMFSLPRSETRSGCAATIAASTFDDVDTDLGAQLFEMSPDLTVARASSGDSVRYTSVADDYRVFVSPGPGIGVTLILDGTAL